MSKLFRAASVSPPVCPAASWLPSPGSQGREGSGERLLHASGLPLIVHFRAPSLLPLGLETLGASGRSHRDAFGERPLGDRQRLHPYSVSVKRRGEEEPSQGCCWRQPFYSGETAPPRWNEQTLHLYSGGVNLKTYVLSVNNRPLGLITGPSHKDEYPWHFVWNAPWDQHTILIWAAAAADPGIVAIIVTQQLLRDSGTHN